jgi:hypothetical protein
MSLSPTQYVTLRGKVFQDPAAAALLAAGNAPGLLAYLNAEAAPAYVVWRTRVTQDEIMLNGFDWARVDNLSVGKARVWEWLFDNSEKSINPSKTNVRAGIDQAWVGNAQDLAVRAAVYLHCKRNATTAEKMCATGAGTTAVPSLMDIEGEIAEHEIGALIWHDDGTVWTP